MYVLTSVLMALVVLLQPVAVWAQGEVEAPTWKTLVELQGKEVVDVVSAPDHGRLYYSVASDSSSRGADELWLYDRASGRSTRLVTGEFGAPWSLAVSQQGDRLAFRRANEGGDARSVWTLPLDPATGLANGPARRTSLSDAADVRPAFSPDGRFIAFGTWDDQPRPSSSTGARGQLVVVPVNGGPERVLIQMDGVDEPHWAPDGEWIYFMVHDDETIRRIPVAGGRSEILARGTYLSPGLSPDGRFLGIELADGDTVLLADASGKPIAKWSGYTPNWYTADWASSTELLDWSTGTRVGVKSVSLSDGVVRDVLPVTFDALRDLIWSPDGLRFATINIRRDANQRHPDAGRGANPYLAPEEDFSLPGAVELLIANRDGSGLRTIPLPGTRPSGVPPGRLWSPDGRWIAVEVDDAGVFAIDVVDGAILEMPLDVAPVDIYEMRWTDDSKRLRYVHHLPTADDEPVVTEIRETGLAGRDTLLATIEWASEPVGVRFASDTSILVVDDSLTYLRSLTTGRSVQVFDRESPGPTVSRSGRLLAMRPPSIPPGNRTNVVVVTPAGDHVADVEFGRTIGVFLSPGVIFTPDERSLIATGRREDGECCAIYTAPISGGPVRTLVDLVPFGPPGAQEYPAPALSPDGDTLLFFVRGQFDSWIGVADISPLIPPTGRR